MAQSEQSEQPSYEQLAETLAGMKEEYNRAAADMTAAEQYEASQEIKVVMRDLSAAITRGAKACPDCGEKPHGIKQPMLFEVGCLTDADHRAQGETRKKAVDNWNAEKYLPHKER